MMSDEKTAQSILDNDLDSYMNVAATEEVTEQNGDVAMT